MNQFHFEAASCFKFLLETGIAANVPEVAEARFAEATGLAKYPFLAQLITMREYDDLIAQVAAARQERFSTLIQKTAQVAP